MSLLPTLYPHHTQTPKMRFVISGNPRPNSPFEVSLSQLRRPDQDIISPSRASRQLQFHHHPLLQLRNHAGLLCPSGRTSDPSLTMWRQTEWMQMTPQLELNESESLQRHQTEEMEEQQQMLEQIPSLLQNQQPQSKDQALLPLRDEERPRSFEGEHQRKMRNNFLNWTGFGYRAP